MEQPAVAPGTPALPLAFGPYERRGPVVRCGDRWRCTARDVRLQRTITLTLRPAAATESAEGFARARKLAAHDHPALATIYDVGRAGDWAFVACEHLPGLAFSAWIDVGRPTWREVVRVVADTLDILRAIERTASPSACGMLRFAVEDIVVGPCGRVRLLDADAHPEARNERAQVVEVLRTLHDASTRLPARPPRWLRAWLLAPDAAADRWPTRAALAQALAAASPPRRTFARGTKTLAFAFVTSVLWSPRVQSPRCPTSVAEADLRPRLDAARARLGSDVAAHGTWRVLADEVAAWHRDVAAHRAASDHREDEHACLAVRAAELENWLAMWPSDEPTTRAMAPRAAEELGEHALCSSVPATSPVHEPRVAARVRRGLARSRVLAWFGRTDEALGLASSMHAVAQHLDAPRLVAESRWAAGLVRTARGDLGAAQAHLEDALWLAEAIRHAPLVADVTEALVRTSVQRPALRAAWLRHARATRVGGPAGSRRDLRLAFEAARLRHANDDPGPDVRAGLEAMLARDAGHALRTFELADVHLELATWATQERAFPRAQAHLHAARALLELRLGFAHPGLAHVDLRAAELARAEGRITDALAHLARARHRIADGPGPSHAPAPRTGDAARHRIADDPGPLGELDPALVPAWAATLQAAGDLDGARHTWSALAAQAGGPVGAEAAFRHAELLRAAGDREAALAGYRDAATRWERARGPDHPDLAYALTGWGTLALERGEVTPAIAALERAVQLRSIRGIAPTLVAEAQFALARALAEQHPGDLRARALATTAAETMRDRDPAQLREIEAWLTRARARAARDASRAPLRSNAAHRRRGPVARRSPPATRAAAP